MKKAITNFLIIIVSSLFSMTVGSRVAAQTNVVIPGDFQQELGCPGDWQPDCDNTALVFNSGNNMWEATFTIPAGSWQYKVAIDHSWSENYGAGGVPGGANISLILSVPTLVTFRYDPVTHYITDSYNNIAVTLPGSFQSELGCPGDWQPDCDNTALTQDIVTHQWNAIFTIPAGVWEYKVTINHSWGENYGVGGVPGGANLSLNMPVEGKVSFSYDPETHVVTALIINSAVVLAGSFQSELGCSGDWQPDCSNSALTFDAAAGKWRGTFILPAGNFEFKVALDNSWTENYGAGGVLNGPNITLNTASTSKVIFEYDPVTHVVNYLATPTTVVLPGTFQSELGCTPVTYINGDWEPGCDFTRLTYDLVTKKWTGTFNIGAGYWEYKVAIDNSWVENYGVGGIQGGANIPLDLVFPSSITFVFDPVTHIVTVINNAATSGFCVNKFYDANVNGFDDDGIPLQGITFNLSGDSTAVQTTGTDGKACFTGLPFGDYTATEVVPSNWIPTTPASQSIHLGDPQNMYFGNVCLGAGGSRNVAYWMTKKGMETMSTIPEWFLYYLSYLNLKNEDGSDFDPQSFAQLQKWMQMGNAKNMAYKLSVEMTALMLNLQAGFVSYSAIVYMPGCGTMGLQNNFSNASWIPWQVSNELANHPKATAKDPWRSYQDSLRNEIENANNNLTFVQTSPCSLQSFARTETAGRPADELKQVSQMLKIWPNPSSSYFTLSTVSGINSVPVNIHVYDVSGKLVYTDQGVTKSEYRFGEKFIPGLYFVEMIQNGKRSTFKLIKK